MKIIVCTIERVELLTGKNKVGGVKVMFIKTMSTGEGVVMGINWLGVARAFVVTNNRAGVCSRNHGLRTD